MCAIEKITSKTIKIRYPDPEDSSNELVKEVKMYGIYLLCFINAKYLI